MLRPTHAIIDLNAIKHNMAVLRKNVGPQVKFMPVIKANAYGHGIVEIGKATEAFGAEYMGVSIPEEGKRLREGGIRVPILILGGILPEGAEMVVNYDLTPTVFTSEIMNELQCAAKEAGKVCSIHVKVDSGMNRIGVKTKEDFISLLTLSRECPNIRIDGLFTHFAVSEIPDKSFTRQQMEFFRDFIDIAHDMGYSPVLHACNSGAQLDMPDELKLNMVRGGLAMYGYHPGPKCGLWADLRPVLTWKTAVVHVKGILPGDTVSYGRNYTAKEPRLIATLPVGYGDGYKRCISNKAQVLIHGKRAPIVGTICMDQCMADVTDIGDVKPGDEVVLIGYQGDACIGADEMADWADTISYEILLCINDRVPRIFVEADTEQ